MILAHILAAVAPSAERSVRRWIFHLGGVGLIPLGLLDNSLIPLPGSMDVVLIILCARQQDWWFYYALMATAGAVIGGFVTYRLARKGGKETLERKLRPQQVEKVHKAFEKYGFSAIAVPAFLPPPVPITPFLIAAGAMQYPLKKFLAALAIGRIARYVILAYLAQLYGRKIIAFIMRPSNAVIFGIVAAAIAATLVLFFLWRRSRSHERAAS